ncbi:MAG: calcium/sodium antiporter [Acidobacteria bacterium]|nr:calcium/sodium antiporter [Acidobacteriota bacterium]
MSWTYPLLFFGLGLVALSFGAEWLVRGASRIAVVLRVSPLIIGLTIVAYGTSTPEMMASVVAAVRGRADITLGNVLGSNIANIGLILGLVALIAPLRVSMRLMRRELPIMVGVTLLVYFLAWRLYFGRFTGVGFLLGLVVFTVLVLRWARREPETIQAEYESYDRAGRRSEHPVLRTSILLAGVGMLVLFAGGDLVVRGAVPLARLMGISDIVIGASLVAVGTSLPELATALAAARRRQADIIIGNLVGSNLFNILGALGLSALIRPVQVAPSLLRFEFLALLLFTGAMAVVLYTGQRVSRAEGGVLLASYVVFMTWLFLP